MYHTIKVKNKVIMRFYKKTKKVDFSISNYDKNKKYTSDINYLVKQKQDYVDLIYIFKHKGKYSTEIFANEGNKNTYNGCAEYNFESLEEWGNKRFDFSIDDYDIMDKLNLESMSHKDLEFKAKNREKLSFKFKSDAKIKISSIDLKLEKEDKEIKKVTKYYMGNNNLDIDVIFNKKGKYILNIYYYNLSPDKKNNSFESLRYYPIVSFDAKE